MSFAAFEPADVFDFTFELPLPTPGWIDECENERSCGRAQLPAADSVRGRSPWMEPEEERLSMTVIRVESDDQILATREVMLQLRPHIAPADYLETVRRLMAAEDYRLAAALEGDVVRSVAGYRIFETLYCPKLLSLDDLVTDERVRSGGYGKELMEWL